MSDRRSLRWNGSPLAYVADRVLLRSQTQVIANSGQKGSGHHFLTPPSFLICALPPLSCVLISSGAVFSWTGIFPLT